MKKIVTSLAFLMFIVILAGAQNNVYINEFLASNSACFPDEYGEYDDWIEIYNPGPNTVDIGGYFITDDLTDPAKYQIPTGSNLTQIQPGGFLILWADEDLSQGVLHTDIKLSAGGEEIGLYLPSGTIVDSIIFGAQTTDVSFGRETDGGTMWTFFNVPTPGASNSATGIAENATNEAFEMFPNPAGNLLHINNLVTGTSHLQVLSLTGLVILESDINDHSSDIHLHDIAKGVYIVRLTPENGNPSSRRLIIQ